jgi:hypothetical protein
LTQNETENDDEEQTCRGRESEKTYTQKLETVLEIPHLALPCPKNLHRAGSRQGLSLQNISTRGRNNQVVFSTFSKGFLKGLPKPPSQLNFWLETWLVLKADRCRGRAGILRADIRNAQSLPSPVKHLRRERAASKRPAANPSFEHSPIRVPYRA